ncbi:MAG TPA: dynamin family protein, partial [Chloroflexota bacterium]|nr:dynamin family protein [Chloroflexota bacterium]
MSLPGIPQAPLRVLGPREAAFLTAEREALSELREALASLDADPADLTALRQAALDLDDLFLIVVVGEFNAGKSALLNALLGSSYLEEGVTPTTAEVSVIRYGPTADSRPRGDGTTERTIPAPVLKELSIVDTPGTNAIIRQHEQLTREFVPRSDLVLFVTSVDRPFSESERAFMEHIRTWGKKVLIVLNKTDLLRDPAELAQIERFVSQSVTSLLGFTPEIFPVSGRLAYEAKAGAGDAEQRADAWRRSNFEALERYLSETLDEAERVRLKLLNPLGIAERVAARQTERTGARLDVLRQDLHGAGEIEGQLDLYRSDLRRDFERRLHEVENVVHELNDRADAFFDETLRLARVFDLFNADRVRAEFERRVISDSAQRIDTAVQSLVDWMLDQEQRLWRSVAEYVNARPLDGSQPGQPGQSAPLLAANWSFAEERRRMLDAVERAADQALTQYDAESEAKRFSLSMREAVTQTALTQVGALSLGTAVVALIGTTAADVTGILAASVVAGLGLYIIPLRRRRAREEFRKKTEDLRQRLKEGMTRQF